MKQQEIYTRKNVSTILGEGIVKNVFKIDNLELNIEVFLHSIGYFFPVATTDKYYEPEEEKLVMVIDWFIEEWLC